LSLANQKWDFVAIQPFSIDTLKAPVEKMIKAGVPVIDMDTLISPLDQIDVHSFLAPDNEFMGAAVTQVLMDQIGDLREFGQQRIPDASNLGHVPQDNRSAPGQHVKGGFTRRLARCRVCWRRVHQRRCAGGGRLRTK
jgi:ABC-type xylose transport system substrate-binding protein